MEKAKSDLRKSQNLVSHLKITKIAELEVDVSIPM